MAQMMLIQRPVAPNVNYYLEYQEIKRPLRAYLFPCTETGAALKDKINDKEKFFSISSDEEHFTYMGIKILESNSQRLLMGCSCGYVFFFDSWETEEQMCPNCHRLWTTQILLN